MSVPVRPRHRLPLDFPFLTDHVWNAPCFSRDWRDSAYRYPRPTPLVRLPHAALHERRVNLLPVCFPLLL